MPFSPRSTEPRSPADCRAGRRCRASAAAIPRAPPRGCAASRAGPATVAAVGRRSRRRRGRRRRPASAARRCCRRRSAARRRGRRRLPLPAALASGGGIWICGAAVGLTGVIGAGAGAAAAAPAAAAVSRPATWRASRCRARLFWSGIGMPPGCSGLTLVGRSSARSSGTASAVCAAPRRHAASPARRRTTIRRRTAAMTASVSAIAISRRSASRRRLVALLADQFEAAVVLLVFARTGWTGCATSHLLHRLDPEHRQPRGDDERHPPHQRKTRPGQIRIRRDQKRKCRVVLALGPQQVELRRDFLQKKGDAVRLVRLGGALDDAAASPRAAESAPSSGRIGEPVERRLRQRRVAQLRVGNSSAAWRMTEAARACAYCT